MKNRLVAEEIDLQEFYCILRVVCREARGILYDGYELRYEGDQLQRALTWMTGFFPMISSNTYSQLNR